MSLEVSMRPDFAVLALVFDMRHGLYHQSLDFVF